MQARTRRSRVVRSLIVSVAMLWSAQRASADIAPRWTDEQLIGFADAIVRGHVARIDVARDAAAGAIYTSVSLDVSDVLKGEIPDRRIVIRQLGGRVGSTALHIGGQATFEVGEDVIVFLEQRPRDRTWATTALWQGKFTIVPADGGDLAVRQDPGGPARGIFSGDSRAVASWLPVLRGETAAANSLPSRAASLSKTGTDRAPSAGIAPVAQWWDAELSRASVRIDSVAPGQAQLQDRGEPQLRSAADFWSAKGVASLAAGGLQPSGCFTAREPDGRIAVGVDGCNELSTRGGTIAVGGSWIRYDTDAGGHTTPRFLGGGVITNAGDMATRLLANARCFEEVAAHEIGHALGFADAPDGAGVMASTLRCSAAAAFTSPREQSAASGDLRPTFVPLASTADAATCLVGCKVTEAVTTWAPPPAPTNLTYTVSGSNLTLNWQFDPAGAQYRDTYVIEAGSAPGASDVANFRTNSIATTFSAVVAGNAVFYIRVRAANAQFVSPPSNEVVVTIGTPTIVPGAPQSLSVSATGSNVTLNWSPPATGGAVASYVIQAGSSPGTNDLANFSTGNTATSYFAAGVGAGTYFVRVRAANSAGTGDPSNEVLLLVGPGCAPPAPPTNLAGTVSGSTVTLAWTGSAGATSYQLQVGSSPGTTNLVDVDLGSAATTLVAVNVGPGTYFVRLRAISNCGQSGVSNEVLVAIK